MKQHRCSSILIKQEGRFIGITTDQDFKNKVVAADLKISNPISDIMSSRITSYNVCYTKLLRKRENLPD